MIQLNELVKNIEQLQDKRLLNNCNYWLYFSKNIQIDKYKVFNVENKTKGYIGFFVEDNSRIKGIYDVARSKIKRLFLKKLKNKPIKPNDNNVESY